MDSRGRRSRGRRRTTTDQKGAHGLGNFHHWQKAFFPVSIVFPQPSGSFFRQQLRLARLKSADFPSPTGTGTGLAQQEEERTKKEAFLGFFSSLLLLFFASFCRCPLFLPPWPTSLFSSPALLPFSSLPGTTIETSRDWACFGTISLGLGTKRFSSR